MTHRKDRIRKMRQEWRRTHGEKAPVVELKDLPVKEPKKTLWQKIKSVITKVWHTDYQ